MSARKKRDFVEDWEIDEPAEEEEAEKGREKGKKRAAGEKEPRGGASAPKKTAPKKKAESKEPDEKDGKPEKKKKKKAPAPEKESAPRRTNTAEKLFSKKASDKKKKAKIDQDDEYEDPEKLTPRDESDLLGLIPAFLLPKKYKMTAEDYKKYLKKKARKKAEEKRFREARKELNRRRKAAKRRMKRPQKVKTAAVAKPRQKRGFFASVWRLFDWYYAKTTNPEEKENNIHPKIFGRTLSYTGFMILMLALIVVITLVLNNRTVGIEREQIVVTGLSDDFKGYNILVISDLNGKSFGEDQGTLQRLLSGEKYSMVLMLGDMVGPGGDTEPFYRLIDLFVDQRKPVYFIAGDSDPSPLLEKPRSADLGLTWREMVLSDWVLGAIEHGATYVDLPMSVTKGSSKLWLVPDGYLNLNISDALNDYKDAYLQEQEAYLVGVDAAVDTLPKTYYRRNLLDRTRENLVKNLSSQDLVLMLSHEVPSDSQITRAQEALSESDKKNYFAAPDIVFAGHYCGGEWKLPLIGTLYVDSSVLSRYGWFPDEKYVQGQRTIGGTVIYTTQGLGGNAQTVFGGRLNNPPRVSLITLTGELPSSFLE